MRTTSNELISEVAAYCYAVVHLYASQSKNRYVSTSGILAMALHNLALRVRACGPYRTSAITMTPDGSAVGLLLESAHYIDWTTAYARVGDSTNAAIAAADSHREWIASYMVQSDAERLNELCCANPDLLKAALAEAHETAEFHAADPHAGYERAMAEEHDEWMYSC